MFALAGYTPDFLRKQITALKVLLLPMFVPPKYRHIHLLFKSGLADQRLPFGVDLLLPKVGDGARPTNKVHPPPLPKLRR